MRTPRPRLLIVGLIAALVPLVGACTSSDESDDPADADSVAADDSQLTARVRQDDFQLRYRLDGTSRPSPAVGLIPGGPYELIPSVPWGSIVDAEANIGQLRLDASIERGLRASATTSSVNASRLTVLRALEQPVTAPVAGRLKGPTGSASIEVPGVDVVVDLTPIQDLRYRSSAFRGVADIETVVGQRRVECLAVWVDQASRLHCRLPSYIETAPGLRGQVTLASEPLAQATVVPNSAVGYDDDSDSYFVVVDQDGESRRVLVTVGATDGVVRVVTSPLKVGLELLDPKAARS